MLKFILIKFTVSKKKNKSTFVFENHYSALNTDEYEINKSTKTKSTTNIYGKTEQSQRTLLSLLIFVRNIKNFSRLRNDLINLIGTQNIIFKSTKNNLKIETKKSSS